MHGRLREHFFTFVSRVEKAERIDDLSLTGAQRAGKVTDILFHDRKVIAEVKTLETDTSQKIDPILKPHTGGEHWPVFFGEWPLSKVLERLPNREELNRAVYKAVAGSLEYLVRDAN